MEINAEIIINELAEQNKNLTIENAMLKAQIASLISEKQEGEEDGDNK